MQSFGVHGGPPVEGAGLGGLSGMPYKQVSLMDFPLNGREDMTRIASSEPIGGGPMGQDANEASFAAAAAAAA